MEESGGEVFKMSSLSVFTQGLMNLYRTRRSRKGSEGKKKGSEREEEGRGEDI